MPLSDWQDGIQTIGAGIGAAVAAGFGFRHVLSKLNLTTTSDSAQQQLMNNLTKEAQKWQRLYDETHRLLEAQLRTNALLEAQLVVAKHYLIEHGATEAQLTAMGLNKIATAMPQPPRSREDDHEEP